MKEALSDVPRNPESKYTCPRGCATQACHDRASILRLAQCGVRNRVARPESSPTGCSRRNQPCPWEQALSGRGGRAVPLLGHAVNTAPAAASAGASHELRYASHAISSRALSCNSFSYERCPAAARRVPWAAAPSRCPRPRRAGGCRAELRAPLRGFRAAAVCFRCPVLQARLCHDAELLPGSLRFESVLLPC